MERFNGSVKLMEKEGLTLMYGEPVIFHCNHYNVFLQRTIEDAGNYIPAGEILKRGGVISAYSLLRRLFEEHLEIREPQQRLKIAADIYAQNGFGTLPIQNLTSTGGTITTPITHYSLAWQQKWGQRDKPVDYFTCGYIQAALAIAFYQAPGYYQVEQKKCVSMGHSENEFVATRAPKIEAIPLSPGSGVTIREAAGFKRIPTNVDENGITQTVRTLPLSGNADGLIPAFGVYLTRHFANYYNYITYEAARLITEKTNEPELARDLFVEAGNLCSFNTLGGIMVSDEWNALIKPQCKTREDWVSGIIAVVNALGWGYWAVTELEPGKRMVMRADGSYESNGYLATHGQAAQPNCYLITGGAMGIMNLMYHIDVTQAPALTEAFYREVFTRQGSFMGIQRKSRTLGDPYCEIEVKRD